MNRYRPIVLTAIGFALFVLGVILEGAELGQAYEIVCGVIAAASFASISIGLSWGIFSRGLPVVLRVASGVLLILVSGVCFAVYRYGITLRNVAIINAKEV